MVSSIAVLSLGMKLALGLVVEGESSCPTPAEVAATLAPLLPEDYGQADLHLRLSRHSDWEAKGVSWIRLELFDPSGELVAARRLRGEGDCALLAKRVAAVAAAWQAELSDEPLPAVRTPPEPPGDSETRPPPTTPPAAAPAPAHSHLRLEMEIGASYMPIGGPTVAAALGGSGHWGRIGAQLDLWAEGTRTSQTTVQVSSFSRLGIELGPTLRLTTGTPEIELRADALVAGLFDATTSADLGAGLAGRAIFGSGIARGFVDLRLVLWPRYLGTTTGPELSPAEVLLTVGVSLGGA